MNFGCVQPWRSIPRKLAYIVRTWWWFIWLVVWNMLYLSHHIGNNSPIWLTYFWKGRSTTNQFIHWLSLDSIPNYPSHITSNHHWSPYHRFIIVFVGVYFQTNPLVDVNKKLWKITIFHGNINYFNGHVQWLFWHNQRVFSDKAVWKFRVKPETGWADLRDTGRPALGWPTQDGLREETNGVSFYMAGWWFQSFYCLCSIIYTQYIYIYIYMG